MGSGTEVLGFWSVYEVCAGIIIAAVVGIISGKYFVQKDSIRMLNPVRWIILLFYIIVPFFLEMTRANFDVAYRVITGRIRPGIVRISPGLKTDLGVLLLANSITMTPGTLTVEIDEKTGDFFIHVLNVKEGLEKKNIADETDIFSLFNLKKWVRRIAE
jgi:multicomponent Na+:H+ antiporter subunit E